MTFCRRGMLLGGLALPFISRAASAQAAWPARNVHITVPYSPGGGTDVFARLLAEGLRSVTGQTMVIENRAGGNGVIGSQQVARAEPDGLNLAVVTSTHTMNKYLMPSVPFDALKDFTAVSLLSSFPYVIAAPADAPYKDIASLIAYAKANPGKLSFGTSDGTNSFTSNEFARMADIQMEEVAYRGGSPLMNDIVAGNLPLGWTSILTAASYFDNARVRFLAVTSAERSPMQPNIPTAAESGLPGYDFAGWYGMLAPAGMKPEIADAIHEANVKASTMPQYRSRFIELGADLRMLGPKDFAERMQQEDRRWAEAAKAGLIKQLQ
ncbi:Bug family tripartite tricarboxylate transporter substrate binding protein [Teichococcus oryzae]|uniref:Tripartite tricarboxylate transporter substrate binding protein n=1 Tax=Teichococcus oryzae TaxID=1608942 RepID=A0A5B2TKE6_9PROT|nr:tripartite tricarboxylate transporter substrate binding protein [Pseudoroseomonas oryzae]KAA2214936.1 tripartite tricarboxylate transporter substrate binding protein [Pseudoroseomonas oryzae]